MSRVYFVDLDGVVVQPGTQQLLPGAKEALDKIHQDGGQIFFFSCWAFNVSDLDFLHREFPYAQGAIRKPYADEYVFVDDKLRVDLCGVAL